MSTAWTCQGMKEGCAGPKVSEQKGFGEAIASRQARKIANGCKRSQNYGEKDRGWTLKSQHKQLRREKHERKLDEEEKVRKEKRQRSTVHLWLQDQIISCSWMRLQWKTVVHDRFVLDVFIVKRTFCHVKNIILSFSVHMLQAATVNEDHLYWNTTNTKCHYNRLKPRAQNRIF